MRGKQDGDPKDKVNPFGTGAMGLVATGVIVVALIASVIGLDSFSTNPASQVCPFLSNLLTAGRCSARHHFRQLFAGHN